MSKGSGDTPPAKKFHAADETPVTRSTMDAILATHAANCANVAKEQIESVSAKFMAETHSVLKTYDDAVQKQLGGLESGLHVQQQKLQKLEDDNTTFKQQISELQRLAAIVETTPVATIVDQEVYTAEPDPTKLRIGTKDAVSFDALDKLVASLAEKANIGEEFLSLGGAPLGSQFTLQFTGRADAAARRAKQFQGALRQDNGAWDEHSVDTPAGTSTRVFVDPDKSPKQRDQETVGRSIKKICCSLLPNKSVVLRKWNKRKETTVAIDLKPVVIIECKANDAPPDFWWDEANLEAVGITKQAILDKYEESRQSFRSARAARWSR